MAYAPGKKKHNNTGWPHFKFTTISFKWVICAGRLLYFFNQVILLPSLTISHLFISTQTLKLFLFVVYPFLFFTSYISVIILNICASLLGSLSFIFYHYYYGNDSVQFSSVTQSCPTLCNPMDYSMSGFPVSRTPGPYSDSGLSSWWWHPTISSCVIPFSSHLQSFPASRYFPMSQFFASGGQSIGVSASASVLPMNIQD